MSASPKIQKYQGQTSANGKYVSYLSREFALQTSPPTTPEVANRKNSTNVCRGSNRAKISHERGLSTERKRG